MLSAREADAVLVWHTGRLYRQARDFELLIDIADRTRATFCGVSRARGMSGEASSSLMNGIVTGAADNGRA
ncbi:hypothetical protein [Streptomyces sp. NPDC002671]